MQFYRPSRFIDEIPRYLIKQAGPAKQQSTQTTSKPAGSYSAADFLRTQPKMQQTPTYKKPDSTNWNPLAEKKVKQLQLASAEEAFGFINRNLVDTRYIIKELMAILRAYHTVHEYDTHIVSLKSAFTSIYRQALRFQKNRDIGTQHHAHDAAIIAIADHVLSTYYPNYDQRGNQSAYHRFIEQIIEQKGKNEQEKSEQSKINDFIEFAYYKAYGDLPTHPG